MNVSLFMHIINHTLQQFSLFKAMNLFLLIQFKILSKEVYKLRIENEIVNATQNPLHFIKVSGLEVPDHHIPGQKVPREKVNRGHFGYGLGTFWPGTFCPGFFIKHTCFNSSTHMAPLLSLSNIWKASLNSSANSFRGLLRMTCTNSSKSISPFSTKCKINNNKNKSNSPIYLQ